MKTRQRNTADLNKRLDANYFANYLGYSCHRQSDLTIARDVLLPVQN